MGSFTARHLGYVSVQMRCFILSASNLLMDNTHLGKEMMVYLSMVKHVAGHLVKHLSLSLNIYIYTYHILCRLETSIKMVDSPYQVVRLLQTYQDHHSLQSEIFQSMMSHWLWMEQLHIVDSSHNTVITFHRQSCEKNIIYISSTPHPCNSGK